MTPREIDIVELIREIVLLQEELSRARRRVRQLRRAVLGWADTRWRRHWYRRRSVSKLERMCDASDARLARARDRSHDDD